MQEKTFHFQIAHSHFQAAQSTSSPFNICRHIIHNIYRQQTWTLQVTYYIRSNNIERKSVHTKANLGDFGTNMASGQPNRWQPLEFWKFFHFKAALPIIPKTPLYSVFYCNPIPQSWNKSILRPILGPFGGIKLKFKISRNNNVIATVKFNGKIS